MTFIILSMLGLCKTVKSRNRPSQHNTLSPRGNGPASIKLIWSKIVANRIKWYDLTQYRHFTDNMLHMAIDGNDSLIPLACILMSLSDC